MNTVKVILTGFLLTIVFFFGCDKSTEPELDLSVLYEDAAESISAAMGDESGGVTASFADVMIVSGGRTINSITSITNNGETVMSGPPTYDPATGWWSVSINRSISTDRFQRSITREYQYQFLRNGVAQALYISPENDTATTLKFKIVSGTGYFRGLRVSHNLTSLKGAWTSSNINKDTVTLTLDSIYVRTGVDSIKTRELLRTHTSTLTINSVNVKIPRYRSALYDTWRSNFANAISGTITGNYNAIIAFQRGDAYKERSIDRDFTITVGNGEGSLTINGGGNFKINLTNGQRK